MFYNVTNVNKIKAVIIDFTRALYGYDFIPIEQRKKLIKREYIEDMCQTVSETTPEEIVEETKTEEEASTETVEDSEPNTVESADKGKPSKSKKRKKKEKTNE